MSNPLPLVTITIPAYKRRWLKEAIESVLAQDYTNFELLIVDDHSPQNLKEIVDSYHDDARVKYFYNQQNLGGDNIVYNWNKCIDLASGEYFVLLCDDDILYPKFISTLLFLAQKYPQCNVFHGQYEIYDERTQIREQKNAWPEFETIEDFIEGDKKNEREHTITEFLYRTSFIKKHKYLVFPTGYFSDTASILSMIKNGGIASSKEIICQFRRSDEHISDNGKYAIKKLKATKLYYEWYRTTINPSIPSDKINQILDSRAYTYFIEADAIDRLKILFLVPSCVWGIKQKLYLSLLLFV